MGAVSWARSHRWLAAAAVVIVGVLAATVVVLDGRRGPSDTVRTQGRGDWTRQPAELFVHPGQLVAASDSRWMFAVSAGSQYRYSIKDTAGRTVGDDFDASFGACARTGTGVLGCQIGHGFYTVDLTTGSRTRRAAVHAVSGGLGPIPLAGGWVLGQYGQQRVVSDTGAEKWQVPSDENVVADTTPTTMPRASLVVTYLPATDRRRVRDAGSGEVVADCACGVTLLADGFATETTAGITTLHSADGSVIDKFDHGVRVIAGSDETLIAEPIGEVDASPSRYRVRTLKGRDVWEGISSNGPPRGCGRWILAQDGIVSTDDGRRLGQAEDSASNCLGAGDDWIATPHGMLITDGQSWRPAHGTLDLVDGMLVNTIANTSGGARAVAVYSPTEPAAPPIRPSTAEPDFTTTLQFTFSPKEAPIQRTEITRVSYSADTRTWTVGADGLTLAGKSTIRHPAREAFTVSDRGDVIATLAGTSTAAPPCGPYSVALDDDVARVVIRRDDGRPVDIGAQPDPNHIVAAGAQCVGYSDHHLALAVTGEKGVTLLPITTASQAIRLPYATGFASGRPFAVAENPPTISVYPAVVS